MHSICFTKKLALIFLTLCLGFALGVATLANVNNAYVSTAQIWLQGSDYDIDAVSLQTYQVDKNGKIDEQNAVDGNFYQTENEYIVLVYYKGGAERYDRIIGIGRANSEDIKN